jgi:hypothetical protein
MSKVIHVPEDLFVRLDRAAAAEGFTPLEWLDANLPEEIGARASDEAEGPQTLADLFAGRVGLFSSGTGEPRLETLRESFSDYLEEKHRNGHL